jgi:hypothetical protein
MLIMLTMTSRAGCGPGSEAPQARHGQQLGMGLVQLGPERAQLGLGAIADSAW